MVFIYNLILRIYFLLLFKCIYFNVINLGIIMGCLITSISNSYYFFRVLFLFYLIF